MSKKQAQDVCNGIIATAHQEFRFSEKKRELIRNAIKRAECMEIDYSGMSSDEVQELDDALDLIFACARLLGGETHEKHQMVKDYPFCHCGAEMRGDENNGK